MPRYDSLAALDQCLVSSGPYAGGYLVAPAGYLNVYFAALGLLGHVEERPLQCKAFIDMVLNSGLLHRTDNDNGNYIVYDAENMQTPTPTLKMPDSNDAYASVLLSLASAYAIFSNDWTWFNANLADFQGLALYNLLNARKTATGKGKGMIRTFQSPNWGTYYDVCLTQDNCENYSGLVAFGRACTLAGQPASVSQLYCNAAAALGIAMHGTGGVWNNAGYWHVSDARDPLGSTFYPDAVTQVFPELHGVSSGSASTDTNRFNLSWAKLQKLAPNWQTQTYDAFPWVLLSTVAAIRIGKTLDMIGANFARPTYTVNEAGWQGRIKQLLG